MKAEDYKPVIMVDTREPDPHPWAKHWSCESVVGTLATGDISLIGCQHWICIERKTMADLLQCLCQSRDRFTRELERARRIKDFSVIIEASYQDLWTGNYRSGMNPKSAWESVIALQQRHGIPFLFAQNVEISARLAESILIRWFKEHVKAIEAAMPRKQRT